MVEKNEIMKVVDVHPGTTSSLKKCSKNEYREKSIAKKVKEFEAKAKSSGDDLIET